jgi:hypothetical protein
VNRALAILHKVITRIYYIENTSFFLLTIGLSCGFMSAVEHRALAALFVSSPFTMLIPIGVWVIYAFKVVNFNATLLGRNENEFLFYFMLYPTWQKRFMTWSIASVQLMPAILYGVFLISQALQYQMYLAIVITVASLLALNIVIGVILLRQLHHPNREKKVAAWQRWLNRHIVRPYPTFALEWVSRQNPAMMIGTKLFASAILFGVLRLYVFEAYDFRLLALGTIIAAGFSAQIIGEVHRFDTVHFTLPLQLPLSAGQRIFSTFVSIALIFIPESGIIITYFPGNLSPVIIAESIVCLWTLSFFWYAACYQKQRNPETHSKLIFASVIGWIVAVLFSVPLWAIATVNLGLGVFVWRKYFYRFEHIATPDSQR